MKRTTKKAINEAYAQGKDHGASVASWMDLPIPGETYRTDSNGKTRIESLSDAEEVFMDLCSEAEENSRQYSPFEFTAHEFNESEGSEELWEAFEDGIGDGFAKEWEARKAMYEGTDWDAIESGKTGWDAQADETEE